MDVRYKLKTAAVLYPAAMEDLKRNLHIDTSEVDEDRDALLQDLLFEAIAASQNATGRQYCRATYTLYLDAYPDNDELEITLGPVAAISSVKYYAPGASSLTTVTSTKYQLDNTELTARLRFLEVFSPETTKMNVIEIEFTNGWTTAVEVPKDLKQAVILRASESYLNPGSENENFGMGRKIKTAELKERNYRVQRY